MGFGARVAQACLIAFNFVFVLIGLAGIVAGAIIKIKYDDYMNLTSKNVGSVSILLIAVGGIIFVISFFGCCGAVKKNTTMLTIFIILLFLVLILEIAGAITAYVYKGKLKGYVEDGMDYAMDKYNTSSKYRKAFDTVQKELKCCGKTNASDWYVDFGYGNVPASCCEIKNRNGTEKGKCPDDKIYSEGCVDALFDYLKDHLAIIGGMAIAVAVIQIIGIIFACVVRRDIKEGYGYV